jgi:ABC-type sugar transport system substrate-binding protein
MKVVLLNPARNHGSELFWKDTTSFFKAAAENLDEVEIEVLYSNRNHLNTLKQAEEIANREEKPDYVIAGNEKMTAGRVIKIMGKSEIPVFVFNNSFVGYDEAEFNKPREFNRNWIGKFFPDNRLAGYVVAKKLIEECIDKNMEDEKGVVNIFAVGGAHATAASDDRLAGMNDAVKEYGKKVRVVQTVYSNWKESKALITTKGLFSRYTDMKISGIWAASDVPGFGAATAAEQAGFIVGKDVLIGSVGWANEAIMRVKEKKLVTTVGGHFMDAAWVLILLYDYHNGIDFINDMPKSKMSSIDINNVDKFLEAFSKKEWDRIDFNKFSKFKNSELKEYDFSLDSVLKYLQD